MSIFFCMFAPYYNNMKKNFYTFKASGSNQYTFILTKDLENFLRKKRVLSKFIIKIKNQYKCYFTQNMEIIKTDNPA